MAERAKRLSGILQQRVGACKTRILRAFAPLREDGFLSQRRKGAKKN
jgi:hypothetical protein